MDRVSPAGVFAELASAYLVLLDAPGTDRALFLRAVEARLAGLLASVHDLPEVSPDSADVATTERSMSPTVARLLSGISVYRTVFDPTELDDDEIVVGSLVDDLGDVYRDLAEGLTEWNGGRLNDAIWTWKFGYGTHWGRHATDALKTIWALNHTA